MGDYNLSVSVLGAKELKDAINSVDGVAKQAILDAVNQTKIQLERRARENAYPLHKTGTLWNSLNPGKLGNASTPAHVVGNDIQASVGTNLKYAWAQEAGTVGMDINVKNGRKLKNGNRTKPYTYTGNIPAHFYMKKAKEDTKDDFTNNLQAAVKKIIAHLATK
jgi:hypothetical protein